MDKRLDFGSAFSKVFDLYGKHFVPLITYSAIFYGVIALVWTLIVGVLITSVAAGVVAGLLGAVLTIVGSMILTGAYIVALEDVRTTGSFPSFGEVWPRVSPRLGALVITSLLAGLGILFGMILLIVPGLILATWWYVAAPVVMLEDKSGTSALARSRELVRGNGWTVFGLFVVVAILTGIAGGIIGSIMGGIFGFNDLVSTFAQEFVPGVLTAPISALLTVIVYHSLNGNGFDGGSGIDAQLPPAAHPETQQAPPAPQPPSSTDPHSGPFV